jgi:cell surface protein SprA
MHKIYFFLLAFFCGILSQVQAQEVVQDSVKKGYDVGEIQMANPKSILSAYTYDPVTDTYVYTNSVEDFNINYPIVLTPAEYEKLMLKESMNTYFSKKLDAVDGKKEGSEAAKKDLLPRYYIKSGLFESIFGSNTIDVKPTGSIEIDLGMLYTKQDNPSFSPRNRTNTAFDFNQRISMSLLGKVGTRLQVNANFDTQSTFAFQNLLKLEYTPADDDIVRKIEVGNVSMPLNSTLIQGAQSLFGVKTELQFGKTTVTGVFSEQKSQAKSVIAQGGGTIQEYEMYGLDYDNDRHFFLSQYFRDKYDASLKNYPFIDSRVQITRLEIWVTNKQNRVNTTSNNLRNIIALQDLGESQITGLPDNKVVVLNPSTGLFAKPADSPTDNSNNLYNPALIKDNNGLGYLNQNIREIVTASSGFSAAISVKEGQDYSKLENARKLLPTEYTLNTQLGYISLQQRLANDEILAVAYEYSIGDKVYQVGEFGNDGVEATVVGGNQPSNQTVISQTLVLKMLKSSLTNVSNPVWNLMMKNIYQIQGAYQLIQEDFRLNILYKNPSALNYITPATNAAGNPVPFPSNPTADNTIENTTLLKVLNVDKLNYNNDPQAGGDGFFDFIPGLTVDTQNGRIIFTSKEPFGELLFKKLDDPNSPRNYDDVATYNDNQKKYVNPYMYRITQAGAIQNPEVNKFLLRGKYKSVGGDGISIGAFNVPLGSVKVTAAGRILVEGIDYSVNYQLGRVQILDPSLQASNTPIEISLENNSVFGQQTRRFFGVNVDHLISENFMVGATFLNMKEKPFTQKSSFGQESVNNSIFGLHGNYSSQVPFLTRLVNKLPNIDTDVPSSIAVTGEFAYLLPNASKGDQFQGESTSYVDDFESSQSSIDLRSPYAWSLSSTPTNENAQKPTDYEFNATATDLSYGFKRSKLSWYSIDPVFYTSKPSGISNDDLSLNSTRRVYSEELYPLTDIVQGQSLVVNTLDLSFYPKERGPYNNLATASDTPQDNFGGIVRSLSSTNFEQSNVEYIQFWVMDPYVGDGKTSDANTGKVYFNLGEISEDVLKDGRKVYENGLGPDQILVKPPPVWGNAPASQSLIYAFDNNAGNRVNQDVGLDGLPSSGEGTFYTNYASEPDPAGDDYTYYLNTTGDILDRYKNYNGLDGNSNVNIDSPNRGSSTVPDVEDVNRDNTMNTINAYYEYSIDMKPKMEVGQNFISDVRNTVVTLANGSTTEARWIQFKIPVSLPQNTIGEISDFRSIRFMRMFLTKFTDQVTLRFGALDLIRGEWRRYTQSLEIGDVNPDDDGTVFETASVNIEENSNRCPINYVSPPSVAREQLYNNNTVINQDEQSLSMRVSGNGLDYLDGRGAFKNFNIDMRQYNKLKMFLHAESLKDETVLDDNQMVAFLRFGADYSTDFYQVEIPLKVTVPSSSGGKDCPKLSPELVWPSENEIDLSLELLTNLKLKSLKIDKSTLPADGIYYSDDDPSQIDGDGSSKLRLGIKGNPNLGLIRNIMVGVKSNERKKIKGEVWFNELRLADMDNKGGMAALLNVDTNFADLATVSFSGNIKNFGFGTIEQGPNERSREDIQQYNVVTNINLGKFLPKKWGINVPFNYSIGEEIIKPEYDPFYEDIKLKQVLDDAATDAERKSRLNQAIDYTKRKSINLIGVRKERPAEKKPMPYDVENFTFSQYYNEVQRHDFEIVKNLDQQSRTTVDYAFAFQPKPIEPFQKTKFMKKSSYWKFLSDLNFNYLPSNITFNTDVVRQSNEQEFRQIEDIGIGFEPLFRRNFGFNYQYGFNFNLTKSLKINYTAASRNLVKSYLDEDDVPIDDVTIWDKYFDVGTANFHMQQFKLDYEIPLNKIPVLGFLKANYTYTGDYSWQQSSTGLSDVTIGGKKENLGNTVQNAKSTNFTTTFNMETLYKYIGISKSSTNAKPKAVVAPKPGEKVVKTDVLKKINQNQFVDGLKGILTSLKSVNLSFTENEGTVLPGYLPSVGFFGSSKPTIGFVFGSQSDVRMEAAKNGWLTSYQEFNQNYTTVKNQIFKGSANFEIIPDLKIDLLGDRSYSENFSEQYDVSADGTYNSRSPYSFGIFSVSTILIGTSFSTSNEVSSTAFDKFRDNRLVIANRLATENGIDINNPNNLDSKGFPKGYSSSNQAVLLPAFLAAYTGTSAKSISFDIFKSIPLPNWAIKYTGLMRYGFFKKNFKRFSLQQNYRASYTVNSFRSNFKYNENPKGFDDSGNYYNPTIMSNVTLVEQFNPLVKFDFELKNSLKVLTQVNKDRALSMSFDNNLLTEVHGIEYVVGLGYRIKDVTFASKLADNPTGVIKGDINIKADLTLRDNQTIVRYLDYNNNQLGGGQNIWTLNVASDYSLSKNLTIIFYYNHSFSKPVISTSFPLTNISSGFTFRYTFGN